MNSEICYMIQTHCHGTLKSRFSSSCLIVGLGYISIVLLILQKTNNVRFEVAFLFKYRFCEILFLRGAIYAGSYFANCFF